MSRFASEGGVVPGGGCIVHVGHGGPPYARPPAACRAVRRAAKASGYGRFGGRWGITALSTTRWVTIATQQAHHPF
ncbi:hypothetical protein [Streptomyces geranii]|uniref:hypothetical protein n=1 Tax=Streptomyces geranii TaxID=2058923 RepID=UPI000D03F3CB|nr:hypothetical protein [Streptomyces geranii]